MKETRAVRTSFTLMLVGTLALSIASPTAGAAPGGGNSAATITASFADSCRDFTAHSSKDISHVEIHSVSGRVVKDESITSADYALDGAPGDEIEFAIVKSGTTSERFDCVSNNGAPAARLEIQTPDAPYCFEFWAGGLMCEQSIVRTAWTSASEVPDTGGGDSGLFHWGCGLLSDPSLCSYTFSFRGTGSSDPDNDITNWSLDFGDGASASGSWSTNPPTGITHDYSHDSCPSYICMITLTVTDAAGQSHSNTLRMVFLDLSPD